MAMGTERSKALHNFTMPGELRWGKQRFLRCMKVNSDGQISPLRLFATNNPSSFDHRRYNNSTEQTRATKDGERGKEKDSYSDFLHGSHKVGSTPPPASDGRRRFSEDDDGIAAMREKVMFDLQTAADKMKHSIFKDGLEEGEVLGSPKRRRRRPGSVEAEVQRPWNLRTRRAACKTSMSRFISSRNGNPTAASGETNGAGGQGLTLDVLKPNTEISQKRAGSLAVADKSPTLRSGGTGAATSCEKGERAKFSVALPKSAIEEDFLLIAGHRPPRRPKKRARIVQGQLDTLFPGLWLAEVTPYMYKVSEVAP